MTTHVLDTARGRPAAGMRLTLEAQDGDGWTVVGGGVTDADGRVPDLHAAGALVAGVHRLTFATGDWFEAQGGRRLLPAGDRRLPGRGPLGPLPRSPTAQPVRLQHLPGQLGRGGHVVVAPDKFPTSSRDP